MPLPKSFGIGLNWPLAGGLAPSTGGGVTTLRREANGTVTVLSLATPFTPTLTRQPNGSANVGAA